jgi:hypothetical protein
VFYYKILIKKNNSKEILVDKILKPKKFYSHVKILQTSKEKSSNKALLDALGNNNLFVWLNNNHFLF